MKKNNHLKQDYKKLVAAIKNKDMHGIYATGATNPYNATLFIAAEKALKPSGKILLRDRLAMWRRSRYLCHTKRYA